MVALRIHHHRILHGESGGFSHSFQTGDTHRDVGGSQQAVQDTVCSYTEFTGVRLLPEDGGHRDEIL